MLPLKALPIIQSQRQRKGLAVAWGLAENPRISQTKSQNCHQPIKKLSKASGRKENRKWAVDDQKHFYWRVENQKDFEDLKRNVFHQQQP